MIGDNNNNNSGSNDRLIDSTTINNDNITISNTKASKRRSAKKTRKLKELKSKLSNEESMIESDQFGLPLSRELDTSDPIELHHDIVVEHDDTTNDNYKEGHLLIKELHELSVDSSKAIDFGPLNSKVEYDNDNHEEEQKQHNSNHEEEQQQYDDNHEEEQKQHDSNHEEEKKQYDGKHEEEQKQPSILTNSLKRYSSKVHIPDLHIDEIIEIPIAPTDTAAYKPWDTAAYGISATLASKLSVTSDGLQSKYSNLLEKHLLTVGKIEVSPKPSTATGQFESKYCHLLEKHLLTLESIDTSPVSHESKQDRLFKSLSKEVINLEAKIRGKVTAN